VSKREIDLEKLKTGMYLVGVDRSWFHTPFLRHKFPITDQSQIDALRKAGVAKVTIDPALGLDVEEGPSPDKSSGKVETAPTTSTADTPPVNADGAGRSLAQELSPLTLANHLGQAKQRRTEWVRRISNLFEETRVCDVVAIDEVRAIVDDMVDHVLEQEAACLAVLGLRQPDPTLHEHGMTTCTLAVVLGRALNHTPDALRRLGLAALLHDVGLAKLPRNIIKRSKTMAPSQLALYQTHGTLGMKALEKSGQVDPEVVAVVRDHHAVESNGTEEVVMTSTSEFTKIVAMVDQYDELITGQTGLTPMSSNQALTQLYQRYQGHAALLPMISSLIRTIGVYPLYSLVALGSGELGVVGAITPGKAHLPLLYICRDASRRPIVPPLAVDLVENQAHERRIHSVCDARESGVDVEQVLRQVAA